VRDEAMKIAIASDHAGYELKAAIKKHLQALEHEIQDFGTNSLESVDYVDFVYPAAVSVSEGKNERAILIDGAGYSSGIVANMLPNVFAAVANDVFSARLSREHSNSNILCIGGKVIGAGLAIDIVDIWLKSAFLGGRYATRMEKVHKLAKKHRRFEHEQVRRVVTLQDVKDAINRKESLVMDEGTLFTPSVLDLLR
jgi:ribose 5-phosphate isomerase B